MFNNVQVLLGQYAYFEYTGQFAKGEIFGKGTLFNKDQMRLIHGYFGLGRTINHAAIDITEDVIYEGEFKNDQKHGKGIFMDYKNKMFYVGHFDENQFSGKGSLIKETIKEKYEGEFKAGKYEGQGVLTEDFNHFEGSFQNGQRHGVGNQKISGMKSYEGWYKHN